MESVEGSKTCTICNKNKPLTDFYSRKAYNKVKGNYIYYQPYCKECAKKKARKWEKENWEKKYNYNKKKREENPEYFKEYRRRYYDNNREKVREDLRKWYHNNKDKAKEYRQHREQNKTHEITTVEWEDCKMYFDNCCAYCGLHLDNHYIRRIEKFIKSDFHKEHVNHEGANDISNCVPSCASCNGSKWLFELDEWYIPINPIYDAERLQRIKSWLEEDYKKFKE